MIGVPPEMLPLPIVSKVVRFAVYRAADGVSSNSWRFWTSPKGDAYLQCRDSFNNVKFSLHQSGHWRMGYTVAAAKANPALVPPGHDRAWEKWREPEPVAPGVVAAIRLPFVTSELTVRPEWRAERANKIVYLEAAPAGTGKMTVVTVFVTEGDIQVVEDPLEPSVWFGSLPLLNGRRAQLVASSAPDTTRTNLLAHRDAVVAHAEQAGLVVPERGVLYFYGEAGAGMRTVTSARVRDVEPDKGNSD